MQQINTRKSSHYRNIVLTGAWIGAIIDTSGARMHRTEREVKRLKKNMMKLKGLIVEKGTTQEYVAKSAGITRSTFYRKICSGGGEFTANEIRLIKETLGLTNDEVLTIFLP